MIPLGCPPAAAAGAAQLVPAPRRERSLQRLYWHKWRVRRRNCPSPPVKRLPHHNARRLRRLRRHHHAYQASRVPPRACPARTGSGTGTGAHRHMSDLHCSGTEWSPGCQWSVPRAGFAQDSRRSGGEIGEWGGRSGRALPLPGAARRRPCVEQVSPKQHVVLRHAAAGSGGRCWRSLSSPARSVAATSPAVAAAARSNPRSASACKPQHCR